MSLLHCFSVLSVSLGCFQFFSWLVKIGCLGFLSDRECESTTKILDSGVFALSTNSVEDFVKYRPTILSTSLLVGNSKLKYFISLSC